jgi:hypothetical protein
MREYEVIKEYSVGSVKIQIGKLLPNPNLLSFEYINLFYIRILPDYKAGPFPDMWFQSSAKSLTALENLITSAKGDIPKDLLIEAYSSAYEQLYYKIYGYENF